MKSTIGLLTTTLMIVGCGSSGSSNPPAATTPTTALGNTTAPYVPTTTGVGANPGSNFAYGGTANFTFANSNAYYLYTGRYSNNLSNVVVNLNLTQQPPGNYFGGTVTVQYTDNGLTHVSYFTGGNSNADSRYNVVYPFDNGRNAFHGIFEDYKGAIVVVVNPVAATSSTSLGDGVGTSGSSGSVYFKNFSITYADHPPSYCWFVSIGPYDCRAWIQDNGINTFRTLLPDNGYQQLGTFTGLNISSAFNGGANF